jgi:hypothetical protein
MNTYKKYVFTRSDEPLEWSNVELVPVDDDEALLAFVEECKAQPGGDIHLSGGAQLARTIAGKRELELESATAYSNGVVGLYYI